MGSDGRKAGTTLARAKNTDLRKRDQARSPDTSAQRGRGRGPVFLTFSEKVMHFFDPESEKNLLFS